MEPLECTIKSCEEMLALGEEFGRTLKMGDLVLLQGDLGAGKTTFTQGIGRSLGIQNVTSPTFVISRIYPAKPPLVHVDAYRLIGSKSGAIEFDDLDLDTHRDDSITVIEWGSDLVARLAERYFLVEIEFLSLDGVDARRVVISKR